MRCPGLVAALAGCFLACACHRVEPLVTTGPCVCPAPPAAEDAAVAASLPGRHLRSEPAFMREPGRDGPHVTPLPVCDAKGRLPLEAAREYYDTAAFEQALSCAAQAAALTPNDVLAWTERANALAALSRFDEAKLVWARALALQPDSLDALLGAAHLYTAALPSSRENDELGGLYSERGFELAKLQRDEELAVEFARLSSMAFNDLGESELAVARTDWVLKKRPKDPDAQYERGVALFELCRFDDAQRVFEALLADEDHAAHAHQHLGLIIEREALAPANNPGRLAVAEEHLAQAQKLAPDDFLPPILLSPADFAAEVERAVAALPAEMRRDLGEIPVETADLPALEDLTANDPPLSPTILGLFRGPSLGEECDPDGSSRDAATARDAGRAGKAPGSRILALSPGGEACAGDAGHAGKPLPPDLSPARRSAGEGSRVDAGCALRRWVFPPPPPFGEEAACRSLVLYRKNLARAVRDRAELTEQIRVTLLHEVGHLRGEDDYELAARGLE